MYQLNLLNYILIILAIAAFYPYGRRLGIKPFFTATLVGICFAGLIIGSLANFYAGLIRWVALASIIVGWLMLIKDYYVGNIRIAGIKKQLGIYIFLVICCLGIFMLNNPRQVFFAKDNQGISLIFNRHYSYYSSQSIEMLNARYMSRLRVSDFYPVEWARYHFFNAATQASVQAIIPHPGLFTYWIAQTLIILMILMSFIEILLLRYGFNLRNCLISLAWLAIGLTFFADSLTWNLLTTGALSVFAITHLFFSSAQKNSKDYLLYILILGASVFRLLPIALAVFAYLAATSFGPEPFPREQIKQILKQALINLRQYLYYWIFTAAFLVYNVSTIIFSKAVLTGNNLTHITQNIFDQGWLKVLSAYKLIGLIYHRFHASYFSQYNSDGMFDRIINHPLLFRIFALTIAIICLFFVYHIVLMAIRKQKFIPIGIIILLVLWIQRNYLTLPIIYLYMIIIPYVVCSFMLVYLLEKSVNKGLIFKILISVCSTTLIMQYFDFGFELKEPVMYITFDIALWALLGLYMFSASRKIVSVVSYGAVALVLVLTLNFHITGLLKLPDSDPHTIFISASDFSTNAAQRSDFAQDGSLKISGQSADTRDIYASVFGVRMNYSSSNRSLLNYQFLQK